MSIVLDCRQSDVSPSKVPEDKAIESFDRQSDVSPSKVPEDDMAIES